jgi:hypothetical protein
VSWVRTDVPEKGPTDKSAQENQTWFPQYDLAALNGTNAPTKPMH